MRRETHHQLPQRACTSARRPRQQQWSHTSQAQERHLLPSFCLLSQHQCRELALAALSEPIMLVLVGVQSLFWRPTQFRREPQWTKGIRSKWLPCVWNNSARFEGIRVSRVRPCLGVSVRFWLIQQSIKLQIECFYKDTSPVKELMSPNFTNQPTSLMNDGTFRKC
jgi:hypothetical protein